jgi:hypothetical protein
MVLQVWVLSAKRSMGRSRVDVIVRKQRRQMESLVPSALLLCWKEGTIAMAIGVAFFKAPEGPEALI